MRGQRISFFFIFFLWLGGCIPKQHIDLRRPIYLITDPSLFSGCKKDIKGPAICKEWRLYQIRKGVNNWFKHFDEPMRPRVFIVPSHDDVPVDATNTVIHLQISKDYCESFNAAACYHYKYRNESLIVFVSWKDITARVFAHELGHAFGREHDDTPEEIGSVMSYSVPTYVLPVDITLLCQMHDECPAYNDVWCEGSFYDELRCPSSSFEEGQAALEAYEEAMKKNWELKY